MSLARAHYQRTLAARENRAADGATSGAVAAGPMVDRMAVLLRMHQGQLNNIQSKAARIEAKRAMLPEYSAYIDGVLAADGGAQDDIVTTVMLWRLDTGDWDGAIAIAAYAMRHDLQMPFGWSRTLPATVAELVAEGAIAEPVPAMLDTLRQVMELTSDRDMHDQVRAKLYKAMGLIVKETDPAVAIENFEAALALHPNCGVKAELSRLKKAAEAAKAGT